MNTQGLTTPELDWSSKSLSHPQRIYSKINVINGTNSGTFTTTSQGSFSFQIPAKVLSLKDSYVSMDIAIATAGGAGNASVIAGNLSNIFSRIVCSADNNATLFDINDFHRFSAMLTAPSMKFETLEQECICGTHVLLEADATTSKRSPFNVLQKNCYGISNLLATTITPVASKPGIDYFTGGRTAYKQENLNPNGYRHWIQQTYTNPTTTNYSIQFRLKDLLPHTICSLDQLLYFGGSQLQFDFYLNNIDYIGYKATSTTLTTTGVAGVLPATTFSNFQFNLCTESNINVINAVMEKVRNGGIELNIPYVYGSKTTITSASPNVNQVITQASGKRLMWVAWAPFLDGGARDVINSHTQIDCSAVTGQPQFDIVFSNYNTSLDNIFIKSQSPIDCTKGEHWLYNKNELKGSALQGLELLSNDFVNIDSWIGKPLCEYDPSVEDGLILNENHTWGLTSTFTNGAQAYQHYVYYCAQKKLVIQPFSVQVV